MTTYESALSELSGRLIGTGSTLTNSLSEILALALFWTEFLGELNTRGLTGVKLVTSDAHAGLVNAIGSRQNS